MDWRALEARVDKAMTRAFGEQVRLSFMKGGRADPDRGQLVVRGVLHTGGNDSFPLSMTDGQSFRTRLAAGQAELFLNRSEYGGPAFEPGDSVRALDRAGQPRWEVASISDRYSHLIVVSLTEAAR